MALKTLITMMKPYNFYPESITVGRYTHIEVHAVEEVDGEDYFEQCDHRPHDADMWSVYGRTKDSGLECLADCPTQAEAQELCILLECCMYGMDYRQWHEKPKPFYVGTNYNQIKLFETIHQARKNAAGYTVIQARTEREAIYLFNQEHNENETDQGRAQGVASRQ